MLTIRKAQSGDFEAFCTLVREVDALHFKKEARVFQDPGEPPRPREYYESVLASEEKDLFLADQDGVCVGYLQMELKRSPKEISILVPQEHAWVSDLVVAQTHRRRGVGRALMAKAREWSRGKGCRQMRLTVFEFNSDALEFYESEGLKTLNRTLIQEL